MSTPTIGEIRIVGFTFAPPGWVPCAGQLLPISEYDTLFMLLGTTYGGDGQNTFAVPDFRGRIVPGTGAGPGLSNYTPGQMGGVENVTLTLNNLASHGHPFSGQLNGTTQGAGQNDPVGAYPAASSQGFYATAPTENVALGAGAVSGQALPVGGNQPHNNIQPVLALNYIIATEGIFPSQP
ncbi:phage tail protein [Hymenobacter negativus]|uniref:Phage tail protein n=1 Tax=Hymenobacter negativus TaxID=2795026 RepID=A0ABS3QJ27_9BACT|nr:tail fiber protein [Hymenobacter negativus]MBO2010988.1 phage tail protein [Hymenobacter negativus]